MKRESSLLSSNGTVFGMVYLLTVENEEIKEKPSYINNMHSCSEQESFYLLHISSYPRHNIENSVIFDAVEKDGISKGKIDPHVGPGSFQALMLKNVREDPFVFACSLLLLLLLLFGSLSINCCLEGRLIAPFN